jgi:hypothetical protein
VKTKIQKGKMKYSYPFIFLIVFVFLISIASALTCQQWRPCYISHPIRIDGAADASIFANITIKNPDGVVVVSSEGMTYRAATTEHNYTLLAGKTEELGIYQYTITAKGGGLNSTSDFEFDVTPSGQKGLLGFYFLVIILSYGVLVLGIAKRDIPITLLATFALFFLGLYVLFYGLDIFKNQLTNAFAIITLGVASYVSVRMAYETIELE